MEMCKTLLGFAHFHRHRRHEPKQQNRTLHLLQKPDIFICYRHLCFSEALAEKDLESRRPCGHLNTPMLAVEGYLRG